MVAGNDDLEVGADLVRPKTAPEAADVDDWPSSNKAEQIAALSQRMKNLTSVTSTSKMID